MKPIPYGKQAITDADIEAVVDVLKSDFLTQGPKIKEFEDAFAQYIGCKYAVAVSNGTAALHLSTIALNVKPHEKIITTPITFAASANCVRYCDGEVIFSDIDPLTYLIDINKVRQLLENNPPGTYKGIIVVDFAGLAVNLEQFRSLADEYGLWILEDACHAPGGFFVDSKGVSQRCGNGVFADLAIFSFHPVKHIAVGEGGMITTNSKGLYDTLNMLRTHGITRDQHFFQNPVGFSDSSLSAKEAQGYPGWYMEMQILGYNYRLTDFQAALGISQLGRAEEGLERRRALARRYDSAFSDHPFIQVQLNELRKIPGHAYHLYVIQTEDRLNLYNYLRKNSIYPQVHYIPTHLMPYYRQFGWKEGDMPNAEKYYKGCLSLPLYPTLTDDEQDFVIKTVLNFFKNHESKS